MKEITSFDGEYEFLSDDYPCTVMLNGVKYTSVTHAYNAAKTFDADDRFLIHEEPLAKDARRRGFKVALREDWEEYPDYDAGNILKFEIKEFLTRQKFMNEYLRGLLLATKDAYITAPGDSYWGGHEEGQNMQGSILMKIRRELALMISPLEKMVPKKPALADRVYEVVANGNNPELAQYFYDLFEALENEDDESNTLGDIKQWLQYKNISEKLYEDD